MATRAKIVLACAEPDVVYAQLAKRLGVTTMTVSKVRKRFAASRLDGLVDRPRAGRPKVDLVLTDLSVPPQQMALPAPCECRRRWARA